MIAAVAALVVAYFFLLSAFYVWSLSHKFRSYSKIYWFLLDISELNKFSPDLKHFFYSSESQLEHHHHRGWKSSLHTRMMTPATALGHLHGDRRSAPGLAPGTAELSWAKAWLHHDGDFEMVWSLPWAISVAMISPKRFESLTHGHHGLQQTCATSHPGN